MSKLTDQDREVIRRFAAGEKSLRDEAAAVFERCHRDSSSEIEMEFMSEVLNPAPDLLRRGDLRRRVVMDARSAWKAGKSEQAAGPA